MARDTCGGGYYDHPEPTEKDLALARIRMNKREISKLYQRIRSLHLEIKEAEKVANCQEGE